MLGWLPIFMVLPQPNVKAQIANPPVQTVPIEIIDTKARNQPRKTAVLFPKADLVPATSVPVATRDSPAPSRQDSRDPLTDPASPTIAPLDKADTDKDRLETIAPQLHAFMEAQVDTTIAQAPPRSPGEAVPAPAPTAPTDPELGVIRLRPPNEDPELGIIQLRSPLQDPELGILELRSVPPPTPPQPLFAVYAYVTASSSDNIFLVEYPVQGRIGDNFIRPGVIVYTYPSIGPRTNLLASIETSLLRYQDFAETSYDELRFRTSIRHNFTDRVYGQIGWSGQLLFDEGYGDQFFTNHGLEWTLGRRDALTPELTLNTFYQGQVYLSDPSEFSNLAQSLGVSLNYRFHPQWDTGITYRLTISDFIEVDRHETYQRISGQLRYAITPAVRMSIFGGLSYGRSSRRNITFDDTFFGISLDATIQVFE